MVKQANLIEVEIDGPQNQALYFRPLQRRVRGRFDLHRVKEPNAGKLLGTWPDPIPGQRLALNVDTGEAAIVEPLYEPQYAAIRERIEAQGRKLGPERESFKVDVPTWAYWLQSAVSSGVARVTAGTLPESIEGMPRLRFHSAEQPDPIDRLTTAIERQCELQAETLKLLAKLVTDRS